jgi:hypothetical protein
MRRLALLPEGSFRPLSKSFLARAMAVCGLFIALIAVSGTAKAESKTLHIPPVAQSKTAWCWLAASEMVFRYYHVPPVNSVSYQCGLAAAVFGGPCVRNCEMCNVGSGPVQTIQYLLLNYPPFAENLTHRNGPKLTADVTTSELSEDDVKSEIDADRPVIAGISPHSGLLPPGLSEHAVVIVGYVERSSGLFLVINDPFPYDEVGMSDPYTDKGGTRLMAGRYRISYDIMVNDLAWGNTVSGIDSL